MNIKNFSLPILGILTASTIGLMSRPTVNSASALGSNLYNPVSEHYEISGHNLGTEWEMVTSLSDLADEQIVTLAAIDDTSGEPVTKVLDSWCIDDSYISTLDDGYIDGNHLYSNSAQPLMFDSFNETHGYLSTLENGVNETIGCYKDEFDFFQITPKFDNSTWKFEFDPDTHKVTIFQYVETSLIYFSYWNGCDMFMVSDDDYFSSSCSMYLFKDKFVHSGNRQLSDVTIDGTSLIYDFASTLLDTFDGVCDPDGDTDMSTLNAAVLSIYNSDESDALRKFSKKIFLNVVASETGDVLQRAAALYDYVMIKYPSYQQFEWFGRKALYSTNSNVTSVSTNNIAIIAVCSFVALTGIGLVALKLKKKEKYSK